MSPPSELSLHYECAARGMPSKGLHACPATGPETTLALRALFHFTLARYQPSNSLAILEQRHGDISVSVLESI